MADFRYYCLNDEGQIILGAYLAAADLPAAIRVAYEACRDHPHFTSSRIEVWQGTTRLYATNGDACEANTIRPN